MTSLLALRANREDECRSALAREGVLKWLNRESVSG
jgi:hypothetical protein